MQAFKDSIFCFEEASIPDDLRVVDRIYKLLHSIPNSATLIQYCQTLEKAATAIDEYKAATCGSPYALAIINLNEIKDPRELAFLLKGNVLGNPRTIFLNSLRRVNEQVYAIAKEKVMREAAEAGRTPSCIDCYGAGNREEICARVSQLARAYLREDDERQKAKQSGLHAALAPKPAADILKKSATAFHGRVVGRPRSGPH